jgi:hypothetical protein
VRKGTTILLVGLLICAGAFAGFYLVFSSGHRQMLRQAKPELAWLKDEFKLSDAEFTRISHLHEAYLPLCRERCRRIREQNEMLDRLLARSGAVTPEIQALLAERAKTRADCEAAMLKHFLEVSKAMPAEQGQRYLSWVERQSSLHGQSMEKSRAISGESHM